MSLFNFSFSDWIVIYPNDFRSPQKSNTLLDYWKLSFLGSWDQQQRLVSSPQTTTSCTHLSDTRGPAAQLHYRQHISAAQETVWLSIIIRCQLHQKIPEDQQNNLIDNIIDIIDNKTLWSAWDSLLYSEDNI